MGPQRAALAQDGKATLDVVESFEELVDGSNSLLLKLSQRRSRPAGDAEVRAVERGQAEPASRTGSERAI